MIPSPTTATPESHPVCRADLSQIVALHIRRENDIDALIAEIKAQRLGRPVTTQKQIREWRDEGRLY
jgi:hypothetical protein